MRRHYEKNGPGAPFKLQEMMDACGTDYESRRDYEVAHSFLINMRKGFEIGMLTVFGPKEYGKERSELREKLEKEGRFEDISPEKVEDILDNLMFKKLTDAAYTYGFFPVYADLNNDREYAFFNKESLIELMRRGAKKCVSEINFKAQIVEAAIEQLPSLAPIDRPKLENDGKLIELPSAIECEVCHQNFDSQLDFTIHFNQHIRTEGESE